MLILVEEDQNSIRRCLHALFIQLDSGRWSGMDNTPGQQTKWNPPFCNVVFLVCNHFCPSGFQFFVASYCGFTVWSPHLLRIISFRLKWIALLVISGPPLPSFFQGRGEFWTCSGISGIDLHYLQYISLIKRLVAAPTPKVYSKKNLTMVSA